MVWYSIASSAADRVDALLGTDAAAHASSRSARASSHPTSPTASPASSRPRPSGRYVRESHELLVERSGLTRYVLVAHRGVRSRRASMRSLGPSPPRARSRPRCCSCACRTRDVRSSPRRSSGSSRGDRVHVRTAGSEPAAEVRSSIVTALDEIGVPTRRRVPEAADRRSRAGRRRRRHDGLRRRLPRLPWPALPRLGPRRPGRASPLADGACDPRRHRGPRARLLAELAVAA